MSRARVGTVAILAAGLAVYLVYFAQTRFDVRNFDSAAHLAYIQFIVQHHALPDAAQCTVCHHPPAYHLLAAAIYSALQHTGLRDRDPTRGLQLFSLVLWMIFVCFAALTLERLIEEPRGRLLALGLVIFWPYSVMQSVRVNNDTLVDALAAVVIYCSVRWLDERRTRWLLAAAGGASLALLVKASALTLVALVGALAALGVWRAPDRKAALRSAAAPLAALVVVMILFGALRGHDAAHVLGRAYQPAPSRGAGFYLRFSPRAMLATPYPQVTMSRTDEPSYWNHLAKSSLYGARTFGKFPPGTVHPPRVLILVENGLLMMLFAGLALGLILGRRDQRGRRFTAGLLAACFLAGGLGFHLLAPNDHHADFRFILPILIPLAALYAWAVETRWLRHVGTVVAVAFMVVSIASFAHMTPDPADAEPQLFPLRPSRGR